MFNVVGDNVGPREAGMAGDPSRGNADNRTRNQTLRVARKAAKAGEESLCAGNTARALAQFRRALQTYAKAGVQHTKLRNRVAQLVRYFCH